MWFVTLLCGDRSSIIAGVGDAAIATALALATGVQSTYVPDLKSRCSHLRADHRFAHTLSFYELAGRLNGTLDSGENMCRAFHEEWAWGIPIL